MIKHLRFFVLNLLVLISAAVMAQTTVDFSDGLPSDWTKTGTVAKQTAAEKSCIQLQKGASITSPAISGVTKQIVINLTRSSKGTTFTVAYKLGDAAAVTIKTFEQAEVTKNSWADFTIDVPAEAQVDGCQFVFTSTVASYYISQIDFVAGGAPTKAETTTTFGEGNDTITFVGDAAPEARTATVTPAEATAEGNGVLKYKSSRTDIVTVDEETGALTWGEAYGTAKITATYTPAEGALFKTSSAYYYVKHKRAADPNTVVFDASDDDTFANLDNMGYNVEGDCVFTDLNGDSYTFNVHNAMRNYYGHGLQLKKASATDESAQGYVISPVFEKFEYGYRVTVKYEEGHGVELSCLNYPTEVAALDDAQGTVYMDVPFVDGIFQISGGSQVSYVSSIELTPLAKPAEPTTMSFPEAEYNVNLGDAFEAPKAKITNELGAEIAGLPLIYTSDNEGVASVDENSGNVTINAVGTAKITAYFIGNADYAASQAEYTLNVTEKQQAEPGFYYEEPALEASVLSTLTLKQQWFHNPNNIALVFASSDENVATVDEEGNVTTLAAGTTEIKASFEGNDEYLAGEASYTLTVTDKRNESSLSFGESEYTANMAVDGFFRTKLINEKDLTPIVYTSSNPEVAEIGEVPETVKLNSVGETTITATFEGNSFFKPTSASYKLTVVNEVIDGINGISLNAVAADAKVYNLNGQSVSAKQLKKGVYVVNGKKVVVK